MKKVIGIIIVFTMMFTSFAFCAEDSDLTEYDNIRISNYNAQLLADLELYPAFNEKNDSLTRGEFIAYIIKLYGVDYTTYSKQVFSDVSAEHTFFKQINAAYTYGLISGNENKLFAPNDNITFSDAMTIMVRLLGYTPILDDIGGVFGAASKSGLLNGVTSTEHGYLNAESYALLMKNLLTADIIGSNYNGNYSIHEGQTVLHTFLKLKKVTGQVISCYDTSLYSSNGCGKGEFILNTENGNMIFESDLSRDDAFRRLGHTVDVYYKEVNELNYAVSAPIKTADKELTVYSNELNLDQTNRTTLSYYPNGLGRKQTATISKSAYVIYNRLAFNKYTDNDFKITDGNIRLIDTDYNGDYDIVFISSYDYTLVSYVSLAEKRIIDQYFENSFTYQDDTVFSFNGNEISPSEIVNMDLLQVEKDKEGTVHRVSKIADRVAGAVESVYDTGCIIDETEYQFSGFYKKIASLNTIPDAFKIAEVGKQQCLLLNEQKEIIAIVDISGSGNSFSYGYLIALAKDNGVAGRISVRMLTTNDTVSIFQIKSTLRVDGKTMADNLLFDYLKTNLGATESESILEVGDVVRYCLNDSGEICELDTVYDGEREHNTALEKSVNNVTAQYSQNAKSLEGYVIIGGKSNVFVVPENMKNDTKYYRAYSDATSLLNHQVTYSFSAYDIARNGIPGVLLIVLDYDKASGGIGTGSAEYIFDREVSVLGNGGEIRNAIKAYTFNGEQKLIIQEGFKLPKKLNRGDLFRVGWSPDYTEINNFQLVLDLRNQYGTPKKSTANFTNGDWSWFGQVIQVADTVVKVRFNDGVEQYFDCSSARGKYLYDGDKDKIEVIGISDIHGSEDYGEGDWIMLYSWIGQIKDIFVYRNIGD